MFRGVKLINNLAHVLRVLSAAIASVLSAAIACVKPPSNTPWATTGCKFEAIVGNHIRCNAHQGVVGILSPTTEDAILLGPEFLRFSLKVDPVIAR